MKGVFLQTSSQEDQLRSCRSGPGAGNSADYEEVNRKSERTSTIKCNRCHN